MLILHAGAKEVSFDELRASPTPEPTATHVPVAHSRVVDVLRLALDHYGHEISGERHGLTGDGMRYFGLISLTSKTGPYEDAVCIRNSHDMKFPIGFGFGGRVFCCDNLMFIAAHVIKRKHTLQVWRDFPEDVDNLVVALAAERRLQRASLAKYMVQRVSDFEADAAVTRLFRTKVITTSQIPFVIKEWDTPTYPEFANDKTAWRLFNAATSVLSGRLVENPQRTQPIFRVLDELAA